MAVCGSSLHVLKKPIEFEGKTYENLVLDFDSLTGKDVKEAKREFDRPNRIVCVLSVDVEFAAYLSARAAHVPYALMDYLPAPDYVAITQAMINFLLLSGFSETEAAKSERQNKKSYRIRKVVV